MSKEVVGLELGKKCIRAVKLRALAKNDFELVEAHEEPVSLDAEIEDEAERLRAGQLAALKKMQEQGILTAEALASGFFDSKAQLQRLNFPFDETKKIEAVLLGELDSELPFDSYELCCDWYVSKKGTPEKPGSQVIVGYAQKEDVRDNLSLLQEANIDPRIFSMHGSALQRFIGFENPDNDDKKLKLVVSLEANGLNMSLIQGKSLLGCRSIGEGFDAHSDSREHFEYLLGEVNRTLYSYASSSSKVEQVEWIFDEKEDPEKLKSYLAQAIAVPVRLISKFDCKSKELKASFAAAFGYAHMALFGLGRVNKINFRKGEFAFKSDFTYVFERKKPLIAWALALAFLFFGFNGSKSYLAHKALQDVQKEQQRLCKRILGRKIRSSSKCLAMIKDDIAGGRGTGIPDFSAIDAYLELTKLLPSSIPLVIDDLEITSKNIRFKGETGKFEHIDELVEKLQGGTCFTEIKKGRARQQEKGVKFQMNIKVDCKAEAA